jgi:lipopolysaccharide export system protein LptA
VAGRHACKAIPGFSVDGGYNASKIRAFMKFPTAPVALALWLALAALPAGAEKADRNKPMNIEADTLRYDDLQQTSVFTGKVVVTKGTIVIRGAKMTVRQDPEGYQFGVVTAEPGKQAFFRQKRDGVDEFIEGEAETIEYDGRADKVKFIGRAEMRRLQGAVMADETSGAVITYDNSNDQFTVDGGAPSATPSNPGGRVRATLAPRSTASAPAAAAPAVPAASAPRLRPATTLGQEKR